VGDGADELAVLDNGRARHSLNDTAGLCDKIRIADLYREAFACRGVAVDI